MNISQVREKIGQIFSKLYEEPGKRVIVEKSGIVVGAVVSPIDLKRLEELDKKREKVYKLLMSISQAKSTRYTPNETEQITL